MSARKQVNWRWICDRAQVWQCQHSWMVGSRKPQAKACRKCGIWHWFPLTPAGGRSTSGGVLRSRTRRLSEAATVPPAGQGGDE